MRLFSKTYKVRGMTVKEEGITEYLSPKTVWCILTLVAEVVAACATDIKDKLLRRG